MLEMSKIRLIAKKRKSRKMEGKQVKNRKGGWGGADEDRGGRKEEMRKRRRSGVLLVED